MGEGNRGGWGGCKGGGWGGCKGGKEVLPGAARGVVIWRGKRAGTRGSGWGEGWLRGTNAEVWNLKWVCKALTR